MSTTKHRSLTRCRNRVATGPTVYVMRIGDLTMLVPRRALLLDLHLSQTQQMVRDYRRRHLL
jgi:hypothetical protein